MKSFTVVNTASRLPSHWLAAVALWLLAALLRGWLAPIFAKLPADYAADIRYTATLWSRQTPESAAEESTSIVRRHDQALAGGNDHAVVQGDAHWLTTTGAVIFETFNLYGVDRYTRQNLAGYGNQDRTGQFLFPPHTQQQQYTLWDSNYGGPATVHFDRVEQFRGLEVYVFNSTVDGIDETDGYAANPEVPEKYRVRTSGHGRLWIEPVSGVVVDHKDDGVSDFIDPTSGQAVGEPINRWQQRYTPETVLAQVQHAIATRRQMLALELALPLSLFAAGLIWLAIGWRAGRRSTP